MFGSSCISLYTNCLIVQKSTKDYLQAFLMAFSTHNYYEKNCILNNSEDSTYINATKKLQFQNLNVQNFNCEIK